jgi:ribosomal protein L16 Arg81 hydroxylase
MRFEDLVAPIPVDRFLTEYFGASPLHIKAASDRPPLIDWKRLNDLLAIRSHWSEGNIKLIMNSRPVVPDLYIDELDTLAGRVRRANPVKVDVFLAMGASLVGNSVEEIAPEVHAVTALLGDRFAGRAGANVYCSFGGVQAFASHCDLHEVFALQCEGEKVWNIYENRALSPVVQLEGNDAQAMIDSVKGRVLLQARMQPGDLLYIPRGYYHDALAEGGASLHLSFGVAPLTGRALFSLLDQQAIEDEAFRHYLPDARLDNGRPLAERLDMLAARLAAIVRGSTFRDRIADRQQALAERDFAFTLPARKTLEFFAWRDRPDVRTTSAGAVLARGPVEVALGAVEPAAQWMVERPAFPLQQLFAAFPHVDEEDVRAVVGKAEQQGWLFPYTPEV